MRYIVVSILAVLLSALLLMLACYLLAVLASRGRIYKSADGIPFREVGMLLGTSPTTRSGADNVFYTYRIDAAERLYKAGKIRYLLISGDNSRKDYSEPDEMKRELVRRGIPAEAIYLDYAGFRTWDSVVRARRIFGLDRLTVISQRFHNERSILIGRLNGVDIIGYDAKDAAFRLRRVKVYIREAFARVKIFVDVATGKQPHFLGAPIEIGEGKPQKDVNP